MDKVGECSIRLRSRITKSGVAQFVRMKKSKYKETYRTLLMILVVLIYGVLVLYVWEGFVWVFIVAVVIFMLTSAIKLDKLRNSRE